MLKVKPVRGLSETGWGEGLGTTDVVCAPVVPSDGSPFRPSVPVGSRCLPGGWVVFLIPTPIVPYTLPREFFSIMIHPMTVRDIRTRVRSVLAVLPRRRLR